MVDSPVLSRPHGPPSGKGSHQDTADLVRGAIASLLGKLALSSRALATVLMTNLFGPVVFGLYTNSWNAIWVVYKVARFGLHQSATRVVVEQRAARHPEGCEQAIGASLLLGLLISTAVSAALTAGAPLLAALLEQPDLASPVRIMAWSLPFMVLSGVLIAVTRALRIMRYSVYVNSVAAPMILLMGTALSGLCGWGMPGLAGMHVAMGLGMLLLSVVFTAHHFRLRACLRRGARHPFGLGLTRFSFPVMLSDLISALVVTVDQFILLRFVPLGEAGLYAAARQVSIFMRKPPQAFDTILGPIVADLAYQRRTRHLGEELAFVLRWTFAVNLAYLGLIYLGGDRIMLAFGAEFTTGATAAWVLCLGMLGYGVSMPLEVAQIMGGHPYVSLLNNTVWLVSMVGLDLWWIPRHGVVGAAWAATTSLLLVSVLRLVQIGRMMRVNPLAWSQLKPFGAAAVAVLVGRLAGHFLPLSDLWSLVPELVLSLAAYLLALWALGLDERDRMLVDRLRRQVRKLRGARLPESGESEPPGGP
ncbi:MAG: oligosaccharide flippase family protein [Candidatus Latescibacterota bacterium]